MGQQGIVLNKKRILKIWDWTQDDIQNLYSVFDKRKAENPTNGYAIFLVAIMDIWGSIFRDQFGDESPRHSANNIEEVLKRLYQKNPSNYPDLPTAPQDIVKILRHNLVHQYGLAHYKNSSDAYHLNIDFDGVQPAINLQTNQRWHIDCDKLKNDLLVVIEDWLRGKGLI